MYENSLDSTHPGTDINVTPDKDAPIIPKATMYQGDCLSPLKKEALLSDFPVIKEIPTNIKK
jgi:hypothetical protein